jgi:hypothetical protein
MTFCHGLDGPALLIARQLRQFSLAGNVKSFSQGSGSLAKYQTFAVMCFPVL